MQNEILDVLERQVGHVVDVCECVGADYNSLTIAYYYLEHIPGIDRDSQVL